MKLKKIIKTIVLLLSLCIAAGIGIFLYNASHSYNINSGFESIPLNYNPDESTSTYNWNEIEITATGAFVKGIQSTDGGEHLVIRAISPLPKIKLSAGDAPANGVQIELENINPDLYASKISSSYEPSRIKVNTLLFNINIDAGNTVKIVPTQPTDTEEDKYIILGDSRDGYETFDEIITQVDAIKPAFVINNGDLVFSGKQNQYRIFDQMVSGISTTLCTTLGNHDIRGTGRETYTKLYGPNYYAFDYGNNHFIFLDSSPGFTEMQAISTEQYAWLERDLKKSQGKDIYVISHVPSTDPRSNLEPNNISVYINEMKRNGGIVEQKLEDYTNNEKIDHGFQDKLEAKRFESLMSEYHVKTVYLSHIHSYFDYSKDGVRYVISGGAGAELLTQNSYYHYLIAKLNSSDTLTMVQLPSPPDLLLQRYVATANLFAEAMYRENKSAVILFISGLVLLGVLLLLILIIKHRERLTLYWKLMKDSGKYIHLKYKDLFK